MIPFNLHRRIPLLRRSFFQRDQAIAERDALLARIDRTSREPIPSALDLSWFRHRPSEHLSGESAVTEKKIADDALLVARIITAYRAANTAPLGSPDSFWLQTIAEMKRPVHDSLMRKSVQSVTEVLRNPAENMLFYGFDTLTKSGAYPHDAGWREWNRQWVFDNLLRLAESVGARRLEYPEAQPNDVPPDTEAVLESLDRTFGFRVTFPNPYPDEVGLATSRGVACYRAVQALYQAYRIVELAGRDARVIEIGAGLGRTAYYAWQLGIRDYTIIDIPMTNVAQGYFLGRTLGPDAVSLHGEDMPGVRVLLPEAFLGATDRYDIAINVDSLTEMARDTAKAYCGAIKTRVDIFLSINHEYNVFTARDICAALDIRASTRTPYWMRRGYVDEVFRFA